MRIVSAMHKVPKISVQIQPQHVRLEALVDALDELDALRVDTIYCWDHIGQLSGSSSLPSLECWALLASLSRVTSHVKLGSLVSPYGWRNPELMAYTADTVDRMSGGRVVLGMGAGWHASDFERLGLVMPAGAARIRGLQSALDRIRASLDALKSRVPVLIGGSGPKLLDVVAQHADIWHSNQQGPAWARAAATLEQACHRRGRDPRTIVVSVSLGDSDIDALAKEHEIDSVTVNVAGPRFDLRRVRELVSWRAGVLSG
ncbi:MAG TPA: LLM class flavin-dependent oxidoreductase [Mycobacteriales bacterium]|nr:LLM class flavin-dependent oxidoreductase [Mycobacteriales bacterium]